MERAGIRTPTRRLTRVGDRGVLLLRRFDRSSEGRRIGYISAMTALGAADGDHRDYTEITEAVRDLSASPRSDLSELFARVVTSVLVGNTDDHLRNHGFLAVGDSWTLSPAFDVNPTPEPWRSRSTTILGADALPDEAEVLLDFAEECDLTALQARRSISSITTAVSAWRGVARGNGIAEQEIARMAESIEPRMRAVAAAAG
ncbi:HipA domain-containing protein [Brachybacterium kimchii]|uniref:HipA domain-containing protein n=2 Tax=Brachybacterium kimchii TaxID=2942909 RepID=A0ABY4NDN8_9MICO|nr:HipA domain-containing protein [Brachybacterium kimchii]UQN31744.1 HipA domain-containing protein [Brachybacterium kimchii]